MNPKIIAIIGGKGKMGRRFSSIFEKEGYEVIVSDLETDITNKDAASKADVVIVSVPIRKTIDVIKEIGPSVREGALITDFTSVKNSASQCDA